MRPPASQRTSVTTRTLLTTLCSRAAQRIDSIPVFDSIPARLFENGRRLPEAFAYYSRDATGWRGRTWRAYAGEVRAVAKALIALGHEPGQTACILGFNRPEWVVFDLGAMAAGGVPVGIYATSSAEETRYILEHSEAPVVLVENEQQWRKVQTYRSELPKLKYVVTMQGFEVPDDPTTLTWEAFIERGDGLLDARVEERVRQLRAEDLATLIYTSGTTGPPKGVMLTHENLAWTASQAVSVTTMEPEDCTLSYLPLSHIAEQMFTIHGPISARSAVYFAESLDRVKENLVEVQPTVFFGVPRIWEKFESAVRNQIDQVSSPVRRATLKWAMGVSESFHRIRGEGRTPNRALRTQYRAARRLVFSKLKPRLGLGRGRFHVTGAAPISKETLDFFTRLDIVILEVYGQSEGSGPTTFNRPDHFRLGTAGPAYPGVEIRIDDEGEILVRGPNVFKGYFKDDEATKDTLQNGWLHSGDLGTFEGDFLRITGRKKDILITAGGKNVAPQNIESSLKACPLIGEVVVVGDRRKYLTALITLDPQASVPERGGESWDAQVRERIQKAIDETNAELARVEQIKKFAVLPREFTVENGELTPSLKIKRRVVYENFRDVIESLYREGGGT